jgi:hypothetical protein
VATGGLPPPYTSRAPPRPAQRTSDITTPPHARQLGDSLAARAAQPPLHARDIIRQAARPPPASQGNARTPTLARAQAAAAHTQAHVPARTSLAGAGYGGRRDGGHGGATRAGAHNKRESQLSSRDATKRFCAFERLCQRCHMGPMWAHTNPKV